MRRKATKWNDLSLMKFPGSKQVPSLFLYSSLSNFYPNSDLCASHGRLLFLIAEMPSICLSLVVPPLQAEGENSLSRLQIPDRFFRRDLHSAFSSLIPRESPDKRLKFSQKDNNFYD